MGKPRLFAINLSGNNSVYFAGSDVEGSVSLELAEPKKTQGISITFSGKSHAHWTSNEHIVIIISSMGELITKAQLV